MGRKKTSADYQRQYRQRLREQGLVKKEVWILPIHAAVLSRLEKTLRRPAAPESTTIGAIAEMTQPTMWTTNTLYQALQAEPLFQSGEAEIDLIEGTEPSIYITMKEFGDLPVYVTVAGEQIIVESVMWPLAEVNDPAAFNDDVLRTHKVFPLSTISLDTGVDGVEYYTMFGALSATSLLSNIVFEIEMLADNVIKATEAYEPHLKSSASAA